MTARDRIAWGWKTARVQYQLSGVFVGVAAGLAGGSGKFLLVQDIRQTTSPQVACVKPLLFYIGTAGGVAPFDIVAESSKREIRA